ncbi:hypothetical protein [Thermaurantiacus tibetensis]|uniref:hypothetical protein n=1 Tax=Thermaurantiacus tibetensis TaxID=2759035 RepID=UPI00189041E1|nr:hypothetical protein [Thermaurantiacus tibetensis]
MTARLRQRRAGRLAALRAREAEAAARLLAARLVAAGQAEALAQRARALVTTAGPPAGAVPAATLAAGAALRALLAPVLVDAEARRRDAAVAADAQARAAAAARARADSARRAERRVHAEALAEREAADAADSPRPSCARAPEPAP